jgi:hypothetical protein
LAESGNYTDAVSTVNQLKDLGLSEYDQAYNNALGEIAVAAFDHNNLDAAAEAVGYMTDTSAIDSSKRSDIEKAVATKKAEEERKAREKEIEDAYAELCEMNVSTSESIERAEEILDLLPENYKDVSDFITVFDYYKPYLGRYTSTEYSSSKQFLRITSRKNRKWVVYIGDAGEGAAEFVYPSFTARDDFNSSIYDVWTIQSASTITRVSVRNSNTFYYTYTR